MKMLQPSFPTFPELQRKLIYCDIGARGGMGHPWDRLRTSIRCVSFEPDVKEHQRLSASLPEGDVCHSLALYSRTAELELYLTRSRACSSIYAPNFRFLRLYPEADRFEVEATVRIQAVALDDLYSEGKICDLDFIKIDVQGAELDILQGGRRLISERVLGIESEVEFAPLYVGQPLFSDVDRHLTKEGFQLQDLRHNYWKLKGAEHVGPLKGQIIFGDALYVRPVDEVLRICASLPAAEARGKIEACLIMVVAYGYLDYSASLLASPQARSILGEARASQWEAALTNFGKSLRFWRAGVAHLAFVFSSFSRLFQTIHGGWATSEGRLGSTKRFGWFQ